MKRIQARRNVRPLNSSLISDSEHSITTKQALIIKTVPDDEDSFEQQESPSSPSTTQEKLIRMVELLERHLYYKRNELMRSFFPSQDVSFSSSAQHLFRQIRSESSVFYESLANLKQAEEISSSSLIEKRKRSKFRIPIHNKCLTEMSIAHDKIPAEFFETSQIELTSEGSIEQNPTDKYILKELKTHLFISLLQPVTTAIREFFLSQAFGQIQKLQREKLEKCERTSSIQSFKQQLMLYQAKSKILIRILLKIQMKSARNGFHAIKQNEQSTRASMKSMKLSSKKMVTIQTTPDYIFSSLIKVYDNNLAISYNQMMHKILEYAKQENKLINMQKLIALVEQGRLKMLKHQKTSSFQIIQSHLINLELDEARELVYYVLYFKLKISTKLDKIYGLQVIELDQINEQTPKSQQKITFSRILRQASLEIITSGNEADSLSLTEEEIEKPAPIKLGNQDFSNPTSRKQIRVDKWLSQDRFLPLESPITTKSSHSFSRRGAILKNRLSPRNVYLGAVEQVIHNGEEVEIDRVITVAYDTKLYLIRTNTTNPEELMLLKPRTRSNSISKLDVADIINLVLDDDDNKPDAKGKGFLKKRLSYASRSSTSKALIPQVRFKEKTRTLAKLFNHFIIILPPKQDGLKGSLIHKNLIFLPLAGIQDVDEEIQDENSFIKASRQYMVEVTPISSRDRSNAMKSSARRTVNREMSFGLGLVAVVEPQLTSTEVLQYLWLHYVTIFNILASLILLNLERTLFSLDIFTLFMNLVVLLQSIHLNTKKFISKKKGIPYLQVKTPRQYHIDKVILIVKIIQLTQFNLYATEGRLLLPRIVIILAILIGDVILFASIIVTRQEALQRTLKQVYSYIGPLSKKYFIHLYSIIKTKVHKMKNKTI